MKPIRIAFAAKQRSGKDCAAEFILQSRQGQIRKFADPLYELMYMVQDYVGVPKKKDRLLLQVLGTEWGRTQNEDIWIDKLFNTLDLDGDANIIISDARFINEFEACKKNGFILVKIETDEVIRLARGASGKVHPSETDMDLYWDYDYVITNNGTKEEFYSKLYDMLSDISRLEGGMPPNCS